MLRQLVVAALLALVHTPSVFGFDPTICDVYVFRTSENALWHCGSKLADELYCDHSLGESNAWPFPWASNHPDDWCAFMIATVQNGDRFPMTEQVPFGQTPGPNVWWLSPLLDWGCYVVDDNGHTTESYLVNPRAEQHAQDVTQQCERTMDYFNYWNLHADIRDLKWWGDFEDHIHPARMEWGRCHYDNVMVSPNYDTSLGVEFAECPAGYVCEQKFQDFALCFPDPRSDHECCISWHTKCNPEKEGECCSGSSCSPAGFCEPGRAPENPDIVPGIAGCHSNEEKTEKMLWNRCFKYSPGEGEEDDCADGYVCVGDSWYAYCDIDHSVKDECCKYNYDSSNPRPGDCCVGWHSHCHWADESGKCHNSQCLPGREIGVAENGKSMLDVHDRLCHVEDVPLELSFNEKLGECTGAVCGAWGDPHIITCDNLHYDCQAVGMFTIMKNHMFNIQANFVFIPTDWGGASITNDLAIDYIKDPPNGVPTMQFSFPDFTQMDEMNQKYDPRTRVIGNCPVMFYIDGEMVDISGVQGEGYLYGSANSDHSAKLTGWNQIDVKHKVGVDANGEPAYSTTVIWIEGGGPFKEWSCILTYFICLPKEDEEQFREYSVGLLGTPTGSVKDDWMSADGNILEIPNENRHQASFDYCLENWCVDQESSIIVYEDGLTFDNYKCENQEFFEFDVEECKDSAKIIEECKDSNQPIACQMEKCAGHDDVDKEIEIIEEIITLGDDDATENLIEFPDVEETEDQYGDCTNLGAGVSAATGEGSYSSQFPALNNIHSATGGFTVGNDKSISVLVGGDFRCRQGSGFEGRAVIIGDMTLEAAGCERLAATTRGSLIHPYDFEACVEVGGDVSIDANFSHSKYIMYEHGNSNKGCHFVYGGDGCKINGAKCPTELSLLESQHVHTRGDFKQNPSLDLALWEEQLVLLNQKTNYWKSLKPNGVAEVVDGNLEFSAGPERSNVQIFNIEPIGKSIYHAIFKKGMIGKTIMIIVKGGGDFNVPAMCFEPDDHVAGQQPICGVNSFPVSLTESIVWVFPAKAAVRMSGTDELMGSVVKPKGNVVFGAAGHNGRMIVGGDLTIDGEVTELHNYEYDPASHPLPLGDDLGKICEMQPPPPCNETAFKIMTSEEVCPSKPEGVVKLVKSTADLPEEPMIYNIIMEPPKDGAHTVKFQVDNPFTNYTDIYVKHSKKAGKYGMDPVCESMPFTAGCELEAPLIEVSCHEYDGVDPFALVSIYFASNEDAYVTDHAVLGTEIDKCCHPPSEYLEDGYGIIKYTFEIQCTCPETSIQ